MVYLSPTVRWQRSQKRYMLRIMSSGTKELIWLVLLASKEALMTFAFAENDALPKATKVSSGVILNRN